MDGMYVDDDGGRMNLVDDLSMRLIGRGMRRALPPY
jgi:hypothetical protein